MPTGQTCPLTPQTYPLGNVVYNGITVCRNAKLGISGGIVLGVANVSKVEIWIKKNGANVHKIVSADEAYILGYQSYFSTSPSSTSAYQFTSDGTYSISVLYWIGDSPSPGLGLENDFDVSFNEGDPVVTVQNSLSYFRGYIDYTNRIQNDCIIGENGFSGASNCRFVKNTQVVANIDVYIQGGNSLGQEYRSYVEAYNAGWGRISEIKSAGVLTPGTSWVISVPFTITDSGITGRQYRIVLSYLGYDGVSRYIMTDSSVLVSVDESSPIQCPTECQNGQHCSGASTNYQCVANTSCPVPCPANTHCSGSLTNYACVDNSTTCTNGTTRCKPGNANISQYCSAGTWVDRSCDNGCNPVTTVCETNTTSQCDGMNRDGEFDISCILEDQNKSLLYVGIAAIAALVLLKR
jgi:hypothetical protein